MQYRFIIITIFLSGLLSCSSEQQVKHYPQSAYEALAINHTDTLSAASKRALERHYYEFDEWYGNFYKHKLKGDLAYEHGVIRRSVQSNSG